MSASRAFGWLVAIALTVAACATTVRVPEIPILDSPAFKAAIREPDPKPPVKIVEVPKPLPLPGQLKPVPEKKEKTKDEKQPKERVADANADARIEPAKDGYINAIQVYPYTKGALYQLYAAPAQVTDIALEPGEKLVSVSAGDTVRWVVGDTTSGEGKDAISPHPREADRRGPADQPRHHHRSAHLSPGDAFLRLDLHGVGVVDLSGLRAAGPQEAARRGRRDGGYDRRRGHQHRAAPVPLSAGGRCPLAAAARVRRRSTKVYIQFPSGLAQSEAPPLFVIGPDAKPALVNYRVRGTTYIVDRLFAAAELRLGTAPQRVVRIIRTDVVWRETKQ